MKFLRITFYGFLLFGVSTSWRVAVAKRTVILKKRSKELVYTMGRKIHLPEPGTTSDIYKGYSQDSTKTPVALKVMHASNSEPLQREHNHLSRIHSLHVVKAHGVGIFDDRQYKKVLVLDWVQGKQLGTSAEHQKMYSIGDSVDIAKKILRAVQDLEEAGIRHNDIWGANVMIDEENDNFITLVDFGNATSLMEKTINPDPFAVGRLTLQMITGTRIRNHRASLALRLKKAKDTTLKRDPELFEILHKSMNREEGKRYRRSSEILEELNSLQIAR